MGLSYTFVYVLFNTSKKMHDDYIEFEKQKRIKNKIKRTCNTFHSEKSLFTFPCALLFLFMLQFTHMNNRGGKCWCQCLALPNFPLPSQRPVLPTQSAIHKFSLFHSQTHSHKVPASTWVRANKEGLYLIAINQFTPCLLHVFVYLSL